MCELFLTILHTYYYFNTQRWYVDGSVQCFRGGHAPLGLLAILVLFLSLAIIPITVLLAYKDYEVGVCVDLFYY